jgi:hypothetical protein
MKGKRLNDATPAEWDAASKKALANREAQRKFRGKQKEEGYIELRGVWIKEEHGDRVRDAIKTWQETTINQ